MLDLRAPRNGRLQRHRGLSIARLKHISWRLRREIRDTALRRLVLRRATDRKTVREDVAVRFLRGDGIEIGALDFPLRVPRGARVRYVDYLDPQALRGSPENVVHGADSLRAPDIVDDGARLATFADASVDFVIANHMLEHVEDPVEALFNQLRVIRPGGVLYLSLPDPRDNFDRDRELTTVEHLLRDHREGPAVSRRQHYEECARLIEGRNDQDTPVRASEMEAEDLRVHFHVWQPLSFVALLSALELPCTLELLLSGPEEFIVVLRKR
jgi:SAM-dependent methyltransferase